MTLENYSFSFNGFLIGNNTSYLVTNVEGLGGTSPLRIQDDNRGYLDGSWSGHDFYDERTVYIDVTVLGNSSTTAQANYKTLQNAFAPQPLGYYEDPTGFSNTANQLKLFQFRLNGNTGDMRMYGRSRGITTPITPDFTYGYIECRIMMSFPDPRYYTDAGTTLSGTSFDVVNSGWAISCPTINMTISAGTTSFEITDGTLGSPSDGKTHMYFTNLPAGGSNISVDLLSRVIYLNYVPARNILTAASNGWLQAEPNSTATWRSGISMSVVMRSAFV
jgi:hypothetical protein